MPTEGGLGLDSFDNKNQENQVEDTAKKPEAISEQITEQEKIAKIFG